MGDGWMLLFFGVFALFGYSYMNDIKEQKGRRSRRIFTSELPTETQSKREGTFAIRRIEAGDADFVKYTHAKERAHVHHH